MAEISLSLDERMLLEKIERDSIQYFVRFTDSKTGLTRDSSRPGAPASIAATGFALASFAIAQSRGWMPREKAQEQIRRTLRTLQQVASHEKGFFYHFLDARTGKRIWRSEASSIDTALLFAGALLAAQYFEGTDIPRLVENLYKRVNWRWMTNGSELINHGWTPESGFLPHYWDSYNELIILQALAIGAPQHSVVREAWQAWDRLEDKYNGQQIIYSFSGSLFTYQFAQAFIDFRGLSDRGINYFENSKNATLANWEYSLSFSAEGARLPDGQGPASGGKEIYKTYSKNSWGLSASLGPGGYRAYGGKPGQGIQDGTIAPYASISSIVFTPELSLAAIKFFHEQYKENLYGPYGFKDAFNLDKKWWAQEYLGIDQGISVLMLENFLNKEAVWKKFMELPPIQKWIELCSLRDKNYSLRRNLNANRDAVSATISGVTA